MEEEHYNIDCINYNDDNSEYINIGGETDTRLIVLKDNQQKTHILRPPSLTEGRRLLIGQNYLKVVEDFNGLIEEINQFDIETPRYSFFVSEIHTKEGSKGKGLCLMTEFIEGRCLPLDCQCCWDYDKKNFYIQMDKWLTSITDYTIYKYLSAEKDSLFLMDVFRPIQFVYKCESGQIYLVDLGCNCQFVVLKTSVCVSMTAFSCHFLNMNLKSAHNVAVEMLKKMVKTDKVYKGTGVENVIKDSNLQGEIQIQY